MLQLWIHICLDYLGNSSPPNFCSCLIHQAQLPNKLGNYIFKHPLYFIPMRFRIAGTVRFFKGKVRGLANTLAGVTLGTCSDAMPGLREAAASCFDTLP